MGLSNSKLDKKFGKHSTAKEIIDSHGQSKYLSGKTIIVTGGNSGIGLETCKAFAYAGAKVILCSRSIENGKNAIQEEISKPGHGNYTAPTDNIFIK